MTSPTPVRRIGVEEELMLLDPATGLPAPLSAEAVRADDGDVEVEQELFLQQIETSTEPCADADDLARGLRAGRRAVGEAAAATGARAVAVPTVVVGDPEAGWRDVTGRPRYRRILEGYGDLARGGLVCAMHVHVDVAAHERVRVVDGLRPWLPLLLALSANSPFAGGRDTGHASWRSQVWGRWPSAGTREPFGDETTYREVSDKVIAWGGALDPGMLYDDVRPAARFPTVEVRVADVCTDVEDAVGVALLARALVETVARDEAPVRWRGDLLRVATWRAARVGLADDLVHPVEQRLAPPREVFGAALTHVRRALDEAGDTDRVADWFERLVARGTGATRQRRVLESAGDLDAVVADLARRTEESWA